MALSDWYEILDKQSFGPQSILNVYHVQRVDVGKTASDIFDAFEFSILPSVLNLQSVSVVHDSVAVRNLDDPFDFIEATPTPNVGTRIGDALTQFSAATIQYNRLRVDMKNGQKRIAGGGESDAVGALWDATYQAVMATLGTAMTSTWQVFGAPPVDVCDFGILKRICTTTPSPPCAGSYRLPETDAELEFYIPTTFVVRDTIRSQVSRKRLV